jgi:hypothetical protein
MVDGDIRVTEEMKKELIEDDNSPSKRNAYRNRLYLWQGRIIPYEIDSSLTGRSNKLT